MSYLSNLLTSLVGPP